MTEMMVSYGITPDAASTVSCGVVFVENGHAMQLAEKMDEYGCPTNTKTCNSYYEDKHKVLLIFSLGIQFMKAHLNKKVSTPTQ